MTKELLEKTLFKRGTRVFAILDGASIPDLPTQLYRLDPPNYCLFRGSLSPDVAEVAPYLVELLPGKPFSDWVLTKHFGKSRGIIAHSPSSIKEMRRHFRSIFKVYSEEGNPMLFRFYDPRVLRKFLPTCNGDELKVFFGKVNAYFAEDENPEDLLEFRIEGDELKQSKVS